MPPALSGYRYRYLSTFTVDANRYQLVLLRETKESISVSISYIFLATKITDLFRSKMVEKLIESRVPRTKKSMSQTSHDPTLFHDSQISFCNHYTLQKKSRYKLVRWCARSAHILGHTAHTIKYIESPRAAILTERQVHENSELQD